MYENLALGAVALQSSYSRYSTPNDPLGAISGSKNGHYGFHTEYEESPWWLIDLQRVCPVHRIVIYNRCDAATDRVRPMTISICADVGEPWADLYVAHHVFGGATAGRPLTIALGTEPLPMRFIKISLHKKEYLHLDEVEVYGTNYVKHYLFAPPPATPSASATPVRSDEDNATALGAIVCLTRGYSDVAQYSDLIKRNEAIFAHINSRMEVQYPLVIWHEGNISRAHQEYILSSERNADVRFLDISDVFQLPAGIDPALYEDQFSTSYRLMCKFNAFDIWQASREFKYILRIDEDCIIQSIADDPFTWAEQNHLDYGFSIYTAEMHKATLATLPFFTRAYLDHRHEASGAGYLYPNWFPYTNFGIARTRFFLSGRVHDFLRCAVDQPDFFYRRWGDLPLLGLAVDLFSEPDRISPIPELIYWHGSHNCLINAGSAVQQQPKRFAQIAAPDLEPARSLLAEGKALEAERLLLSAFAETPGVPELVSELRDVAVRLGRTEIARRLCVGPLGATSGKSGKVRVGNLTLDYPVTVGSFLGTYFASALEKVVIQVGANDGIMDDPIRYYLSTNRDPNFRAALIEPVPFYFSQLQKLYTGAPEISVHNVACGGSRETRQLYFIDPEIADKMNGDGPVNNWAHGQGSFDKDFILREIEKNSFRGEYYVSNIDFFRSSIMSVAVNVIRLADLPISRNNRNLLVVMDVQGHELEVLHGIDWNFPPAYIVLEDAGNSATKSAIREYLDSHGFGYVCGDYDKLFARR
jgi:FkbM family methyltransferase